MLFSYNSKFQKSIKTLVMFQVVQKVLPKHFQSERFPQKGSPRFPKRFCPSLLAISLFISPIFGRSLSDCHFRRLLTFRSLLLFNILVHKCTKPVSFDIYPVSPTLVSLTIPLDLYCLRSYTYSLHVTLIS